MKTALSVQTATPTVDVIVPTWNNKAVLGRMLASVRRFTNEPIRIIVVNNGSEPMTSSNPSMAVVNVGRNAGWMGGINAGLKWTAENNPSKFVMFINDDVQVIDHDNGWLTKMLNCFQLDPAVGAVGPTSNAVMGNQLLYANIPVPAARSSRLSGVCLLLRRSVVDEIGGLDESLPGGDDLDYSIRLTVAGYKLCICRRAFLLHHYASTGKRVFGDYWDSQAHAEAINTALIKKHCFKAWFRCVNDIVEGPAGWDFVAAEEALALSELDPVIAAGGKVLDLGCGGKKLHEKMVGVDIRANGQMGVGGNANHGAASDVEADVLDLPMEGRSVDGILAKHLLEHVVDPIAALTEWHRVLKPGGKIVVLCPDYRFCEAISVDPSHVHAFTPESVASLLRVTGFDVTRTEQVRPGYVFMVSARANHGPECAYEAVEDCAVGACL